MIMMYFFLTTADHFCDPFGDPWLDCCVLSTKSKASAALAKVLCSPSGLQHSQ